MSREIIDRVVPRQQTDWDIRGALNFIFGGPGGGVLVAAALAGSLGDVRPFVLLGMALTAAGLFAVWLKIGRPFRALFVFRRPSTSWMSREALISVAVFGCGVAALLGSQIACVFAGFAGLAFAYAQGRILKANIGIPAWRHWSLVAFIVATALVEGFALVALGALVWPAFSGVALALAVLIALRLVAWRQYRGDLVRAGAPQGTFKAFDAIETPFLWAGHAAPFGLALAAGFGAPAWLAAIGGALALAAGAWAKYALVCRAAFTQGFALPRTPSRGKGRPRAGAQPGWRQGVGQGADGGAGGGPG